MVETRADLAGIDQCFSIRFIIPHEERTKSLSRALGIGEAAITNSCSLTHLIFTQSRLRLETYELCDCLPMIPSCSRRQASLKRRVPFRELNSVQRIRSDHFTVSRSSCLRSSKCSDRMSYRSI